MGHALLCCAAQEKLARRISSVEVKVLSPPRPGKKCLVLDIDYTLFDLGSVAERPEELARPFLVRGGASAGIVIRDGCPLVCTQSGWLYDPLFCVRPIFF